MIKPTPVLLMACVGVQMPTVSSVLDVDRVLRGEVLKQSRDALVSVGYQTKIAVAQDDSRISNGFWRHHKNTRVFEVFPDKSWFQRNRKHSVWLTVFQVPDFNRVDAVSSRRAVPVANSQPIQAIPFED